MKLLIVDDHDIVRKGIISALSFEEEFEEINEACNISEGMKMLRIHKPDIAIIDVSLRKNENGMEIIKNAKAEKITAQFVILTSSSRQEDYIYARELGVSGYVLKDSPIEDIIYALKTVAKGRQFFDSSMQSYTPKGTHEQIKEILTDRELEVFRALGIGLTNAQIAERLYITENTVKKHISSILSKLELSHRTEAALYAASLWRRKEDYKFKRENIG